MIAIQNVSTSRLLPNLVDFACVIPFPIFRHPTGSRLIFPGWPPGCPRSRSPCSVRESLAPQIPGNRCQISSESYPKDIQLISRWYKSRIEASGSSLYLICIWWSLYFTASLQRALRLVEIKMPKTYAIHGKQSFHTSYSLVIQQL